MLWFREENLEELKHYTVMWLTNPHTIRGTLTALKDMECFRNGSFHEFFRFKALITLQEVNTSEEYSSVDKV